MNTKNITVIGIGRLGLGFALMLEKSGYNVVGIDINQEYVANLNSKTFQCSEPEYNELLQNSRNFKACTNLSEGINHSDIIFIIVQTPNSGGERFYDHSILSNLLVKMNKMKPSNKDFIIGCTVMPKYIDEIGNNLLSDCLNCHLSYNPEFVAQGDIINGFKFPDIILVGTNNDDLKPKMEEIYTNICENKPKFCFLTPLEAEITKISINGFITTKLSYANMIGDLCDTLNVEPDSVLRSIGNDSRIGNKYFRAGYSFGGPCFPRDTRALKQVMDQNEIFSGLLENTTLSNEWHIEYQTYQLLKNEQDVYVFENVCYKENSKIPIIEESAKLKIAKNLSKLGKTVIIRDVQDIIIEVKKEYGNLFNYEIV
jgi:nucleotide sugar dehydrogenase